MSSEGRVWRVAKLAVDNGVTHREIANELDVGHATVAQKINEVRTDE